MLVPPFSIFSLTLRDIYVQEVENFTCDKVFV